jgi:hypothetical protein
VKTKIISTIIGLCLSIPLSWGQTSSPFTSYEFYDLNYDAQALGQANAYTAQASGFKAMYYNPANLQGIKQFRLTSYLQTEFSPGFALDAVNSATDIINIFGGTTSQIEQIKNIQASLNNLRLKNAHARVNLSLIGTWEGWGIGLHMRALSLDTSIGPDATEAYARVISDAGLMLGKSFGFFDNTLWVGAVTRLMYRASINRSYGLQDFLDLNSDTLLKDSVFEGMLLDVDLGVTYKVPIWDELFDPTISVVLAHLGDQFVLTSMNLVPNSGGTTNLLRENMRAHVGFGVELPKWIFFQPSASLDYRNIGIGPGDPFKHLHLGGALKVTFVDEILGGAFRAGIGQGYITAGLTGYIWWFQMDAAYYVEEVGAQTGQNPDRRLILRLTFEAS